MLVDLKVNDEGSDTLKRGVDQKLYDRVTLNHSHFIGLLMRCSCIDGEMKRPVVSVSDLMATATSSQWNRTMVRAK